MILQSMALTMLTALSVVTQVRSQDEMRMALTGQETVSVCLKEHQKEKSHLQVYRI